MAVAQCSSASAAQRPSQENGRLMGEIARPSSYMEPSRTEWGRRREATPLTLVEGMSSRQLGRVLSRLALAAELHRVKFHFIREPAEFIGNIRRTQRKRAQTLGCFEQKHRKISGHSPYKHDPRHLVSATARACFFRGRTCIKFVR